GLGSDLQRETWLSHALAGRPGASDALSGATALLRGRAGELGSNDAKIQVTADEAGMRVRPTVR
ncbi:hypothetical protein, partial [uncultured Maricaulis sp.]|uniref:hypothetical protein n=1 Tax=uncultured Maricaulis sp. TaxID=174710 RepID=UPI0025D4295D